MSQSKRVPIDSIKCPNCGEPIPITQALHDQLAEEARAELRQEVARQQKALSNKEKQLEAREVELRKSQEKIDEQVEQRVAAEKATIAREARAKARKEVSLELDDLRDQTAEKDRRLEELQKNEVQLRKEKRELEDAKRSFELEKTRQLDAERSRIREEAAKEAAEQHRLKDAEKDRKLQQALKEAEDLRRKLEQGSQQTQGEVLELELEAMLRDNCQFDEILPVPKGVRGADVLQQVKTRAGLSCGSILWEAKHAKNWSDGWISKLKDDQREAKADTAVIVSDVLPKDIADFGVRDGIWITSPRLVPGLLMALRDSLVHVAHVKRAAASKNETVEALFSYLTGPEFRHRVESIVRGFIAIKGDLEEEKRVTARRWAKREKQLGLIIANTGGMYGDLEGLMGTSLQPIPALGEGEPETSADGDFPDSPEPESDDDIPL